MQGLVGFSVVDCAPSAFVHAGSVGIAILMWYKQLSVSGGPEVPVLALSSESSWYRASRMVETNESKTYATAQRVYL